MMDRMPEDGDPMLATLLDPALEALFAPPPISGVPSAWYGHVPFAAWIVAATRPDCMVELGTHCGVSYAAFCAAVLREGLPTRCFAIDSWQGDDHAGHYGPEVYENFRRFHDAHYAGFSEPLRTSFDAAREYFPDAGIDLLHIDGLHTYEAVKRDFENWAPKLSPRAVVLFHDTNVREREFGVWRFWRELRERHAGFEFVHGHGLGVLLIGPEAPERVRALAAIEGPAEIARIRRRFATIGLHHIRRAEAEIRVLRLERTLADTVRGRDALEARITALRLQFAAEDDAS